MKELQIRLEQQSLPSFIYINSNYSLLPIIMRRDFKTNNSKNLGTWGCSALKGGIPTINSNRITPTDHQSAVKPAAIVDKNIMNSKIAYELSTRFQKPNKSQMQ